MKFQPPRGTRDFILEEARNREYIFDIIKSTFRSFGFRQMETPAFESWELLSAKGSGGEELKQEIYYFKDKSDRGLGLRFDLTVPFARVVANNPQLPKPFKRFQIGRVWRYDRPQAGRWREFWQGDIDIAGSNKVSADAECLVTVVEALRKLGIGDLVVRVNSRKLLDGLMELVKIKNKKDVFRSLDKIEKIGKREVIKELQEKNVDNKSITQITRLIETKGSVNNVLNKERESLKGIKVAQEGLNDIETLYRLAKKHGVDLIVDFSLVRGLEYYTGLIFEIFIKGKENLGSISGGGRYDNLIELYGGRPTPATGMSIGVDRIYEIMKNGKLFPESSIKQVFIITTEEKFAGERIKISKALRKVANVETDVMGRNLRNNLEYADSTGIDFVVIIGEKESKQKKYVLRNMRTKKQKILTLNQIVNSL